MVGELEGMYVEMLDSHGIVWSTCVSRFAEPLVARVPELLKRLSGDKLSVLFDSAIQNNTQNTPDFFFFLITAKHSRPRETSYALEMSINGC